MPAPFGFEADFLGWSAGFEDSSDFGGVDEDDDEEDVSCDSSLAGSGSGVDFTSGGISRDDMSSPASAMTAMRVPTLTPFEPPSVYVTCQLFLTSNLRHGHTMILAMMPSSCASTSICALSVSTSSSASPATNSSPSLTFHDAMFPSVIVGDSAGMVKLWAARTFADA